MAPCSLLDPSKIAVLVLIYSCFRCGSYWADGLCFVLTLSREAEAFFVIDFWFAICVPVWAYLLSLHTCFFFRAS